MPKSRHWPIFPDCRQSTTNGLELVAASTPLLIDKLETDLAKLEKALAKRTTP